MPQEVKSKKWGQHPPDQVDKPGRNDQVRVPVVDGWTQKWLETESETMKISSLVLVTTGLLAATMTGCAGKSTAAGTVNSNFPDVNGSSVSPSASVVPNNQDQVVVVEPGTNGNGAIGQVADQDPSRVFCIIIDPAKGGDANLDVCDPSHLNTETPTASSVCTSTAAPSGCSSHNVGDGPDFCQVTGARDYIFVISNPTANAVSVAYEVIDITGYPHQSCADLNITEDTLLADDF